MGHGNLCRSRFAQLRLGLALLTLLLPQLKTPTLAQLVPDTTLGTTSSSVRSQGAVDTIQGGKQVGSNLFHSFREFNVDRGRSLYFQDPGVSNILTRVTGLNPSTINGKLGVLGNANLFLLNPNGIIFGAEASLDIRGSFLASTAAAIQFTDGSEFSATNPMAPDLLTISVPTGLQRGQSPVGATLINHGDLTTGQDLTLDADRLELQGQLHAGRDLTLSARDTLQVRDSDTQPFQAIARGNLLMQGNAGIDILALSHPQTLIQAGNQLTLISDGTISGDAHFNSGGDIALLTTTGAPGNVISLFDPIIRAHGNVIFGNYTGAALKVEATGSIQGGNIRITRPDTAIPTTDPDYTTLTTTPAVILRSGLSTIAGANVPQTIGGTPFTSTPLPQAGNITVGTINTSSTTGNGGTILLSARNGNIRTANLNAQTTAIRSNSIAGNGGDILLSTTNGNITVTPTAEATTAINSSSTAQGNQVAAGNGGLVRLTATNGNIQVNGATSTLSTSNRINLVDLSGVSGNGGAVTLIATQDIQHSGRIETLSSSNFNHAGNGGDVVISSTAGTIQTDLITTTTSGTTNYATLFPDSSPGPNARGTHVVIGANGANAGNVTLTAPHGSITTNAIAARATSTGGASGTVSLSAGGNIRTGNLTTQANSIGAPTATAGDISVTSTGGSLTTGSINTTSVADRFHYYTGQPYSVGDPVEPYTSIRGQGGRVQLSAPGAIAVQQGIFSSGGDGAGDIRITSQTAFVADRLIIGSDTFGAGSGGDITITAPSITLLNGTQISASAHSSGSGGTVTLQAPEFVTIQGITAQAPTILGNIAIGVTGFLPNTTVGNFASTGAKGAYVTALNSNSLSLGFLSLPPGTLYPSGVFTQTTSQATGQGGEISIQTNRLNVQDGGTIATTTFGQGNAGTLSLQANDISVRNGSILAGVAAGATGNGGLIDLQARSLTLTDQGQIQAKTLGQGRAGDIHIQTDTATITSRLSGIISGSGDPEHQGGAIGDGGSIQLNADTLRVLNRGILSTSTFTSGRSGNMTITTQVLELTNGGQLSATTEGQGAAGNITVNAGDRLTIAGAPSGIFANTGRGSTGNGGSIFVTTNDVLMQDRARITVDSQGLGRGGDIHLSAHQVALDHQATIFAETASTQGGNIQLQVRDLLLLRHNSLISASAGTAQAGGNGGNIRINAGFVVGVLRENSDITANAFTGNGGRVDITAQGIFGLQFQPHLTPWSDITASSQFGINGIVTLNTPNVDPSRGLVQLPTDVTDSSHQIVQTCSAQERRNSFVITGRGGVAPDPTEVLNQTIVWQGDKGGGDRADRRDQVGQRTGSDRIAIIEATGWNQNADGSISLITDAASTIPAIAVQSCQLAPVGEE
ncbi:filamentous hemagglutinin N-terminal domain-containing protein [Pantanalinema sp. GBBB05]|uniref:two-partner secretion domain-containing protein n=1 Tax=Pantanalinema sp. GBBB05 TaxID=2604139 RepID=UPI001D3AF3ED|nr:filamentous hemagglutinin N-terminal domain-containing protein [Pantanalinema sp. GBBB05]